MNILQNHIRSFSDEMAEYYQITDIKNGCKNITFQVTNSCTCKCTYCYQINKQNKIMTPEIGKSIIDLLFKMWKEDNPDAFINKKTLGIVLDFIGGEPLIAIDTINEICEYFLKYCIEHDHPWLMTSRFSVCSNGDLFFTDKVQQWYQKFKSFISINITVDGEKELHDSCRIHLDNTGNFDNAFKAYKYLQCQGSSGTKITISPENLKDITSSIKFFINQHETIINMNPIYEHKWTIEEAKIYYQKLKEIADLFITSPGTLDTNIFSVALGHPMDENELGCWCGGQGLMLAFDPDGVAYPCLRYMESSLGDSRKPIIIGDYNGIYNTEESIAIKDYMATVNRRTKSTDECFYCPIASGCSDCAAWNYQESGSLNIKSTNICNMHKAKSLANVYFWNKYYDSIGKNDMVELHLPKEDALNFIDEKEYDMLLALIQKQKDKVES